ncbi:unnamed protein product [Choristocarpus tenellus]
MMYTVRALQEVGQKKHEPLFVSFIELHRAFASIDRDLLRAVLAEFGVRENTILIICQFDDERLSCVLWMMENVPTALRLNSAFNKCVCFTSVLFNIFTVLQNVAIKEITSDPAISKVLFVVNKGDKENKVGGTGGTGTGI